MVSYTFVYLYYDNIPPMLYVYNMVCIPNSTTSSNQAMCVDIFCAIEYFGYIYAIHCIVLLNVVANGDAQTSFCKVPAKCGRKLNEWKSVILYILAMQHLYIWEICNLLCLLYMTFSIHKFVSRCVKIFYKYLANSMPLWHNMYAKLGAVKAVNDSFLFYHWNPGWIDDIDIILF